MYISPDFVNHPYLHIPDIPNAPQKLVGLRRLWENNRKALNDVGLGRVLFMDVMQYLRDMPETDSIKFNIVKAWLEGWLESYPNKDCPTSDLKKEAQYFACKIFDWKGNLPIVFDETQEEDLQVGPDLETQSALEADLEDLFTTENLADKSFSALNITIKGSGSLTIKEIVNSPLNIEGDVSVSIERAEGQSLLGVKISAR